MTVGSDFSRSQRFISEMIQPADQSFDTSRMMMGEPGLPKSFNWRNKQLKIIRVIKQWKETGRCTHSASEMYLRKHWYEVKLDTGEGARIYFQRQSKSNNKKSRWCLFSIEKHDPALHA